MFAITGDDGFVFKSFFSFFLLGWYGKHTTVCFTQGCKSWICIKIVPGLPFEAEMLRVRAMQGGKLGAFLVFRSVSPGWTSPSSLQVPWAVAQWLHWATASCELGSWTLNVPCFHVGVWSSDAWTVPGTWGSLRRCRGPAQKRRSKRK